MKKDGLRQLRMSPRSQDNLKFTIMRKASKIRFEPSILKYRFQNAPHWAIPLGAMLHQASACLKAATSPLPMTSMTRQRSCKFAARKGTLSAELCASTMRMGKSRKKNQYRKTRRLVFWTHLQT